AFRVSPASDHMGRAKPHELAARIGHFEQGTERGLRRLKLQLELGLRRAAEKEERQDDGRTDAYQHAEPLSAIFFTKGPPHSLGCHDHRQGRRRRNRRTIIGEGTDARQLLIGGTSHRGTSQDKGEGEDEAGGPHLTVSGCPWPAAPAVSLTT